MSKSNELKKNQEPINISITDFLGAKNLQYISKLSVAPKQKSAGQMAGNHKSPMTGSGSDFAKHRQYVPGDNLKRLDWKAFARTEKLQIKEFEESTELKGVICLDLSGSMKYCGSLENSWPRKYDVASKIAAAMSFIFLNQGDSMALVLFGSKVYSILPPSSSPAQINKALSIIINSETEDLIPGKEDPPISNIINDLIGRFKHREFFVIVSDFMESAQSIEKLLGHLYHEKHEAFLFQIMDPMEIEFPFRGWLRFDSYEWSEKHMVEAGSFRKAYMESLQEYMNTIKTACTMYGMNYGIFPTNEPWCEKLVEILASRLSAQERS